jgi:hypothetical protein
MRLRSCLPYVRFLWIAQRSETLFGLYVEDLFYGCKKHTRTSRATDFWKPKLDMFARMKPLILILTYTG